MIAVKWSFLSRLVIQNRGEKCSAVHSALLYINSEAVIPAPFFNGVNSNGDPAHKYWIPGQARNDNTPEYGNEEGLIYV